MDLVCGLFDLLFRSEIVAHLEEEHAVTYGTDYLVAGCTMDDQERVAIQVMYEC